MTILHCRRIYQNTNLRLGARRVFWWFNELNLVKIMCRRWRSWDPSGDSYICACMHTSPCSFYLSFLAFCARVEGLGVRERWGEGQKERERERDVELSSGPICVLFGWIGGPGFPAMSISASESTALRDNAILNSKWGGPKLGEVAVRTSCLSWVPTDHKLTILVHQLT